MNIFSKVAIKLIDLYQIYLSPDHSPYWSKIRRPACRYYPTCSEYTKQAIAKLGFFKGIILGFYRILRCNPFSHGGVDHVEENKIFKLKKP